MGEPESSPRFSLRSQVSTESLYGMKSVFFFFLFCGEETFKVNPELMEAEGQVQCLQGGPQSQGCHSGRAGPDLKASPHPNPRALLQALSPGAGIGNLLACPSASGLVHPTAFLGYTAGPKPRCAGIIGQHVLPPRRQNQSEPIAPCSTPAVALLTEKKSPSTKCGIPDALSPSTQNSPSISPIKLSCRSWLTSPCINTCSPHPRPRNEASSTFWLLPWLFSPLLKQTDFSPGNGC